ncbi:hypothetical protein Pmani_009964 [Petrolisthes manimaculis]|uniref:Ionotropic glutamate receptor L-glutamate and glycine-binding domain-containing protein n=1 Tax=Petrolisthes manimaculis TaxID=1843537 RepID=A0AAE1UH83_9EUCA|nr:hypothetical protein Pmani_009964 [Petrolisthes manimaculis]
MTLAIQESNQDLQLLATRINTNGEVTFERVGKWRGGDQHQYTFTTSWAPNLINQYRSFDGRTLKVSANDNWPYFGLKSLPGGAAGDVPDTGIDIQIINALALYLNFTYKVRRPSDGQWGNLLDNGTITGMIGDVANRVAHLAISQITITRKRESVIDFSAPYYLDSLTLVSRTPQLRSRTLAAFSPFTAQVWLCIGLFTLGLGPLTRLFTWLAPPPDTHRPVSSQEGRVMSHQREVIFNTYIKGSTTRGVSEFSFHFFRSLVVQSNLLYPRPWYLRFLFVSWYLFCFYVYALYSGTLMAVLAVPSYETPVDSLWDLPAAVAQGFSVGLVKDTSIQYIFQEAKSGVYQEVWKLLDYTNFVRNLDHGFDKITQEKYLFISSELNSEFFAVQKGRQRFYISQQTFYPQGYCIACFSGAPFLPKFNQMLMRMLSSGLISHWKDIELGRASSSSSASSFTSTLTGNRKPEAITMEHLQAAFFILVLGYLTAVISLVGEVAWTAWSKSYW